MFASFAYYYKSGEQHSINGATYLLPPGLPGAVILDATANNGPSLQAAGGPSSRGDHTGQRARLQQRYRSRRTNFVRPWKERRK